MTTDHADVRILVVDDNPCDVELFAEALGTEPGLTVLSASSVKVALETLRTHHAPGGPSGVHLVLIDLHQPRQGAMDALLTMRESPSLRLIPVIVLTGAACDADRQRCRDLGALDVWTKPFDWEGCLAMAQVAAKTARSAPVGATQAAAAAEWRPTKQSALDVRSWR